MQKLRIIKSIGRLVPGDIVEMTRIDVAILTAYGIAEIHDDEHPSAPSEENDMVKKAEEPFVFKKKKKKVKNKHKKTDEALYTSRGKYGRRDMRAGE